MKDCAFKEPDFVADLIEDGFQKSLVAILVDTKSYGFNLDNEAELMSSLRVAKRKLALLCGLADLGGWWDGNQVTTALSDFAKISLSTCLDFVLLQKPQPGYVGSIKPQNSSGRLRIYNSWNGKTWWK